MSESINPDSSGSGSVYVPEPHLCPRRSENPAPPGGWVHLLTTDHWVRSRWLTSREAAEAEKAVYEAKNPGSIASLTDWRWPGEIPRTCTYCGGIHPEDLIQLIAEGWETEGTGKNYKRYLNPPGSRARTEALIVSLRGPVRDRGKEIPSVWSPTTPVKVYMMHLTEDQCLRANAAIVAWKVNN